MALNIRKETQYEEVTRIRNRYSGITAVVEDKNSRFEEFFTIGVISDHRIKLKLHHSKTDLEVVEAIVEDFNSRVKDRKKKRKIVKTFETFNIKYYIKL